MHSNIHRDERLTRLIEEVVRRRARGQQITDPAVIEAYPDLMPELKEFLWALRRVEEAEQKARTGENAGDSSLGVCPSNPS